MPLVTDLDLLVIEPSVFLDAAASGQIVAWSNRATITGTDATVDDIDLESLGIGAGHVAVVQEAAIEIVDVSSSTAFEVSLPRSAAEEAKVPPGDAENVRLDVISFAALIEQVRSAALRVLGIDADDPDNPLDETAIVEPQSIATLIAMRVLAEAFAGAAANDPESASLTARRDLYRQRASTALHAAVCRIDVNGDGVADIVRPADVIQFRRR